MRYELWEEMRLLREYFRVGAVDHLHLVDTLYEVSLLIAYYSGINERKWGNLKTHKSLAVVLAAVVLASGGGFAEAVITAEPAQAASSQPQIDVAVQQILNNTNAERVKAGFKPLTLSPGMSKISQTWTQKMAWDNNYAHNPSFAREMPRSLTGQAENIAAGYPTSEVVQAWMDSAGHRQNILGNYTHIGIGYWVDDSGQTWFTQNFASYNLNLTLPYQSTNTVQARELTTGWYGTKNESITDYQVELYSPTGTLLQTRVIPFSIDSSPYYKASFAGLSPKTTYTVKTTARNTSVMGAPVLSPTRTQQVTTTEEITAPTAPNAPNAPLALGTTNNLFNETTLQWKAPEGVIGTITNYTVTVKQVGKADRIFNTSNTSFRVTDLTHDTAYTMQVIANVMGADQKTTVSSPAASVAVKTPIYYPVSVSAPTDLGVVSVTHDSAVAVWKAPVGTIGKVESYTVTVKQGSVTKSYVTPTTSYKITALSANTDFSVTVAANAVSVDGLRKVTGLGVAGMFRTSAAPSPIVKIAAPVTAVAGVGADRMTISWSKPIVTGTITGYRVTVKLGTTTVQTHNLSAATYAKTVTALAENTAYTVVVDALAVAPDGKNTAMASTAKTVKTTLSAASTVKVAAPASFGATASRTTVTATWRMPAVTGKVINYTVTLKEGTRTVKTVVLTGGKYSFTGLKANTAYTVYVKANAVSANGKYKASSPLISKTIRTLR